MELKVCSNTRNHGSLTPPIVVYMMYSWVEDVVSTWFQNQTLNTKMKLVKATDWL